MKTNMDNRSLGESRSNYTNSNVRTTSQSTTPASSNNWRSNYDRSSSSYSGSSERDALGHRTPARTSSYSSETTKRKGTSGGKVIAGVLAGAGVGILAGILLAPEKGKDLRKQVANSASRIGDRVTKSFGSTKDKVSSWTNKSNSGSEPSRMNHYQNLTNQSSTEVNTTNTDPALGPTGGTNMQRCL
ncbi:YtxH domain-containing protein [Pontibacter sp. Tf4]|uniref:YtxH domain-containing protein n=1 Tax=Pontibacter sp. Tf4 TaxID=2761620 RepID=UPI001627E963|nr:YtxH domain-containing protein [Pontibacter sp. Tf4]MBB6610874.1 YtxH domain-containing protein [Pontibacter sp. Tf4]